MSLLLNQQELKCLIEILMLSNLIVSETSNPEATTNDEGDEKRFEILSLTQKIYQYAEKNGLESLFERKGGFLNVDDEQISFDHESLFAMFDHFLHGAMITTLAQELSLRDYAIEHESALGIEDTDAWDQIERGKDKYLQLFKEHRFSQLFFETPKST